MMLACADREREVAESEGRGDGRVGWRDPDSEAEREERVERGRGGERGEKRVIESENVV